MVVGTGWTIRVYQLSTWEVVQNVCLAPKTSDWHVAKDPRGSSLMLASQENNQIVFFDIKDFRLARAVLMPAPRIFQFSDIMMRTQPQVWPTIQVFSEKKSAWQINHLEDTKQNIIFCSFHQPPLILVNYRPLTHVASGNQMNTVYNVFIMLFLGTIGLNFEKADVTFVFVGLPAQPQQCENWRSLEFAGFASTGLKLCKVSEGDSSSTETSRTHSATEIPLAARRAMLSDQQLPGCTFSPGMATYAISL